MLRIVDESGEDYLYLRAFFRANTLPHAFGKAVLAALCGREYDRRTANLILTMMVAFGTTITMPTVAQQSTAPGQQMQPSQQMQENADKGIETRNSGDSGYVADQENPGASAHPPDQPDSNSSTTMGSNSGTSSGRDSETGGNPR